MSEPVEPIENADAQAASAEVAAVFSAEQARVFACLMEKQLATPNNYPLTINSLMLACNQKTNRHPVMSLTEGDVGHTVQKLSERGYVSIEYGERANKVFHKAGASLGLKREAQALMAMMMLRGPMTVNELKTRTERMVDFADQQAIIDVLEELMTRETALVVHLPKSGGRREDRYAHTLCGAVDADDIMTAGATSGARELPTSSTQQEIEALKARIARLEAHLGLDTPEA